MDSFDLVSSLQALPETNPIEVDGIQFGPTCVVANVCNGLSLQIQVVSTLQLALGLNILGVGGLGLGSATC